MKGRETRKTGGVVNDKDQSYGEGGKADAWTKIEAKASESGSKAEKEIKLGVLGPCSRWLSCPERLHHPSGDLELQLLSPKSVRVSVHCHAPIKLSPILHRNK
jgi:hypothetical protein